MTIAQQLEQKGIEKGIEQSIQKGIQLGEQHGIEKGRNEGKLEVARAMLANGLDQASDDQNGVARRNRRNFRDAYK